MDGPGFFYALGGYAAKLAHVLGAVIWIGGVLFIGGVATPILKYYTRDENHDPGVVATILMLERRLLGFNWMALWAMAISGVILAAVTPALSILQLQGLYDWVMHAKIVALLPLFGINYLMGQIGRASV